MLEGPTPGLTNWLRTESGGELEHGMNFFRTLHAVSDRANIFTVQELEKVLLLESLKSFI
jgi:ferritin